MTETYIINRKKSISLSSFLLCFILGMLFLVVFILEQIGIVEFAEKKLLMQILFIILSPILLFTSFFYLRQLFNNEPVLVINAEGFCEKFNNRSVGFVKWNDVKEINVIPYMDKNVIISIKLKEPLKYFKKERKKIFKMDGDIQISSIYFKDEIDQVVLLMRYHLSLSQKAEEEYDIEFN